MKIIHLADLHLGKMLHGVSLIEKGDQPAWVDHFLSAAEKIRPDAVVIAGDVYDRSVPSRDAVELLDRLLTGLSRLGIAVLLIAGNHDSGPRLNFASTLLESQRVYISGNIGKELRKVTLHDASGPVHFYLMPYLFPAAVEEALGCKDLRTYDAAARTLLAAQQIDTSARNVLIAHQLVLCGAVQPEAGGSETMVGGVGQIDAGAFDQFDYVALGHIHKPQAMGRDTVRYAGSPLCYHFSEIGWKKGPLLVEIGPKGEKIRTSLIEIEPLHALREIKGEYADILSAEKAAPNSGEYIRVILTDKTVPANALESLTDYFESKGSVLMEVTREQRQIDLSGGDAAGACVKERSLYELFEEFFGVRTGGEFPDEAEQGLIGLAAEQTERLDEDVSPEDIEKAAAKLVNFALGEVDAE